MGKSTFLRVTAICLVSSTIPTTMAAAMALGAAHALGNIFIRQTNTCSGLSGFSSCGLGLPSDFCCNTTKGDFCQPFNDGLSAICCPKGSNCTAIEPITCNTTLVNATLAPTNPLHTVDTTPMTPCGGSNGCCPNGYNCESNVCVLSAANASYTGPSTTFPVSTATSTPISLSSVLSVTPTSTPSASAAAIVDDQQCNGYPPTAIIAGFFPGVLFGIVATILIIMCCGAARKNRENKRKSSDFGSVTATVSDPIYQEAGATRTDFLRHNSNTRAPNDAANRTSRVRSLFSRAPSTARKPKDADMPIPLEDALRTPEPPRTPENRTGGPNREPSMESITIYSPPDGRFGSNAGGSSSRNTTFTEMMNAGGFKVEEPYPPYLGSPGRVDPRSRGISGGGKLR
jgi:hypothetical protein